MAETKEGKTQPSSHDRNSQLRTSFWLFSGHTATTWLLPGNSHCWCWNVTSATLSLSFFSNILVANHFLMIFFWNFQFFKKLLFFFWPHHVACGILVPQPGIKPVPPALGVQSLNHWTSREVHLPILNIAVYTCTHCYT